MKRNIETSVSGTAVNGNPVSCYNGTRWNMTWKKGGQLSTMSKDGTSISYTYDLNGIRKSKTVNGTAYSYITQNGQAVRQTWEAMCWTSSMTTTVYLMPWFTTEQLTTTS